MRLTIIYILISLFTYTVVHAQSNFEIQYHISTQNGAHILLETKKWYEDYFISQLDTWSINSVGEQSDEEFKVALEKAVAKDETLQFTINRSNYIKPLGIQFDLFKVRNSNIYFRSLPNLGAQVTDGREVLSDHELIPLILVRDSLIEFNWSIEDDYKWIDSIRCRKASMTFRCKDYVAWYDPATPVPAGPEQFGGLPGIIVAMTRSGDGVNWQLMKFRSLSGTEKVKIDDILTHINNARGASIDWCEYGQILHRYSEHISKMFGGMDCKTCKSKFKISYYECFEDCQK